MDVVRKGITQAKFNEESSIILAVEAGIMAIIVGVWLKSFTWGIIGFFVFLLLMGILLSFKVIRIFIHTALSGAWAFLGMILEPL